MKSKIISIFVIANLLSCFFFMPKVEAATLQEQKNENAQKQEEAKKELEYVKEELSDAVIKIQQLDDKIREAEGQIKEMGQKLEILQGKVDATQSKLNVVEKNYEQNKTLMEDRMVVMYECGDISYLDLLLSSSSLVEFLSNYYMIEELMKSDSDILTQIEEEKIEIENTKKKLEEEKAELKLLKAKQEQTRIIMQNNRTVQQNQINQLSEEEKKLQDDIQKYKDEEARIEALIQIASGNYTYNGEYSGIMAWPVAKSGTYITSAYGTREHPVYGVTKYHSGIDIGNAGYGAPVIAAADGIVSMASYNGGYGNCVMINHGNGVSTLYGHGQRILTRVGQTVKKGDLIMEVGSTGVSTGPHLHFEVRVNGSCVNPMPYLQ